MDEHLPIREVDPQGDDALALLKTAAEEVRVLYAGLQDPSAPWSLNAPTPPRGVYLICYESGQPVGMGAHRPIDETTTELRRLFVLGCVRRLGIARALLQRIEEHARSEGFHHMVLETGGLQRPAMKLYEACGFTRIESFGVHVGDPTSVCYDKVIRSDHAALPQNAPEKVDYLES